MDNLAVNLGADYNTWANDEVFLAVQIETAQGLANVDAIMATDGVDGCLVGPTDLALSLGVAQGSPEHTAGIHLVLQACRQAGKIASMFAGTTAIARRWLDEGCQFVTVSADARLLERATQGIVHELGAVTGK